MVMLAVPVTLRPILDLGNINVKIITCELPATSSLHDLEAAIQTQLTPHTVLVKLQYRGCQPVLASPLLDFTVSGRSLQPRFQALVRAPATITCSTPAVVRLAASSCLAPDHRIGWSVRWFSSAGLL